MGMITTHWYEQDERVVAINMQGAWTWADCHRAISEVMTLVFSRNQPIDLIIDMRDAGPTPMNTAPLNPPLNLESVLADNGMMAVVGEGDFVALIGATFRKMMRIPHRQFTTADTVEDAYDQICSRRSHVA
jgi:hypothetical protein